MKGDGFIEDVGNFGKKVTKGVISKVSHTASSVGNYFNRVAHMKELIPPNVKKALNKIGDEPIISARVGRTPVQALVQGALRTVANVPYDNLFHLFIEFTIAVSPASNNVGVGGRTPAKWILEKIERITLVEEDRSKKQGAEFTASFPVINPTVRGTESPLTMNEIFLNTQNYMGDRFLPYQSNSNNCQVFIMSVLTSNGLNNSELTSFVKQDTRSIFKNNPVLRKFANTLTDLGGYFNAVLQGGTMIGNNGLTDNQIEELCHYYDIPLNGVYEKSELDELSGDYAPHTDKGKHENRRLSYGNYIINLNGQSHWCAMIIHPKGNFWYDSYGFPAPENLETLMGKYTWNDKQIQDIKSTSCGYFCIAFLKFMERPNKQIYNTFCNLFDDPKKNDKILFSLLK